MDKKKKTLRERIHSLVSKYKNKKKREFGGKRIKGVKRPDKKKQQHKPDSTKTANNPKRLKEVISVGPKGGKYRVSKRGKHYVHKALTELVQDTTKEYNDFIKSFKERKK